MKEKIKLFTDSTTSLTKKECDELDIGCLETTYIIDGQEFSAFEDESTSLEEFYLKLENSKSCSTSCITMNTFEEVFEESIRKGNKVFYLGLSASLSATFENSVMAANNLNKKYGKKLVAVVDSRSASYGSLLLLERAKELIDEGKTLEELETEIDAAAKSMTVAFVVHDLGFMYRCGRLSAIETGLGKLFKIVPLIYVSETGKLKVCDKCLGSKLAYKNLKNKFTDSILKKGHKKCYITTCNMKEEANDVKKHLIENTPLEDKDIKIGLIDKTLACCCGPKTVALFCL